MPVVQVAAVWGALACCDGDARKEEEDVDEGQLHHRHGRAWLKSLAALCCCTDTRWLCTRLGFSRWQCSAGRFATALASQRSHNRTGTWATAAAPDSWCVLGGPGLQARLIRSTSLQLRRRPTQTLSR